nr:centromere protein M isoform X3 [Pongo pygmaeus]
MEIPRGRRNSKCMGRVWDLPGVLKVEGFRATMAQRLVRVLQICAGHVPGVSALNLLSLLRSSEGPSLEDL